MLRRWRPALPVLQLPSGHTPALLCSTRRLAARVRTPAVHCRASHHPRVHHQAPAGDGVGGWAQPHAAAGQEGRAGDAAPDPAARGHGHPVLAQPASGHRLHAWRPAQVRARACLASWRATVFVLGPTHPTHRLRRTLAVATCCFAPTACSPTWISGCSCASRRLTGRPCWCVGLGGGTGGWHRGASLRELENRSVPNRCLPASIDPPTHPPTLLIVGVDSPGAWPVGSAGERHGCPGPAQAHHQ